VSCCHFLVFLTMWIQCCLLVIVWILILEFLVCKLLQCEATDDISKEHQRAVVNIVQALESLPLFSLVKEAVGEADSVVKPNACTEQGVNNCWPSYCTARAHYLAMLMLFWPYPEESGCRGIRLQKLVDQQLQNCGAVEHQLLQNEVNQLRQQFQSVLGYVSKCCNCHCANRSV